MELMAGIFDTINGKIDSIVSGVLGLVLVGVWIYFTLRWLEKEGLGRGLFLSVELLIEGVLFFLFVWLLPEWLAQRFRGRISSAALRWIMLYVISLGVGFFLTHKHGGDRGLFAAFGHLTILLAGWLLGRWIGILFFSVPMLAVIYWLVFWLAQAILPYAEPESKVERLQKYQFLAWYLWGLSFPIWAVKGPTGHEAEKRVDGDFFKDFGKPGIIMTFVHQATGITTGIEFNRVDGPGVIFTDPYQQPLGVVDLRTQLRSQSVSVVLSNGMQVDVVLFASFAIDRRGRSSFIHNGSSTAPLFREDLRPDGGLFGSYPYSSARVRAVLGTTGINTPVSTQQPKQEKERQTEGKSDKEKLSGGEESKIYWDEWVMNQVEQAAKAVLSQRSLDELWRPQVDGPGVNALDEISQQIASAAERILQEAGINLFSARIVNFNIKEDGEIAAQQFQSWKTIWEQKMTDTLAEAQADSDGILERARAQAKSMLLNAIAESLEKARSIDPRLPRHLIVLNYLTALEQFILHGPDGMDEKVKNRIKAWKEYLMLPNGED